MSKTRSKIHINALITILYAFFVSCSNPEPTLNENSQSKTALQNNSLPNIILLISEELSPKHIGAYGGHVPTPHIDQLAQNGILFNRAYTPSALCTPSRYSIMTGQFPGRCCHKDFLDKNPINQVYSIGNNTFIDSASFTLHKHLKKAGYYTGFVGKFHLGPTSFDSNKINNEIPKIKSNVSIDSDEADSLLSRYQSIISEEVKNITGCDFAASIQWGPYNAFPLRDTGQNNIEWITNGAIEFLKTVSKLKPFFLQVNSTMLNGFEPSGKIFSDPKYTPEGRRLDAYKYHPERKSIISRLDKAGLWNLAQGAQELLKYQASLIFTDDQVGILTNFLERTGLDDNTIFIFTSDHGPVPGKSTCFEAGIHIPLLVKWPHKINKSLISNDFIQLVDFLPTLADISNKTLPNDYFLDGKSFLPSLSSQNKNIRNYIYSETGNSRSIFDGRYKYISTRINFSQTEKIQLFKNKHYKQFIEDSIILIPGSKDSSSGYFCADMLYDLKTDPDEKLNLYHNFNNADKLKELKDTLQMYLRSFKHPFPLSDSLAL